MMKKAPLAAGHGEADTSSVSRAAVDFKAQTQQPALVKVEGPGRIEGPPLTPGEAEAGFDEFFASHRQFIGSGLDRCKILAELVDRGGFKAAGKSWSYVGRPLGLEKDRLSQMVQAGRVWYHLLKVFDRNQIVNTLIADRGISENTLRPLVPLLEAPKQLEEAFRDGLSAARRQAEERAREHEERYGTSRKPRLRLTRRHLEEAVQQLGDAERAADADAKGRSAAGQRKATTYIDEPVGDRAPSKAEGIHRGPEDRLHKIRTSILAALKELEALPDRADLRPLRELLEGARDVAAGIDLEPSPALFEQSP